MHRLKRLRALVERRGKAVGAEDTRRPTRAGQQQCAGAAFAWAGQDFTVRGGLDLESHPGARVAAVVHGVIQQAGVAAHRGALAGGAQVGLGGDGVLVVAEFIAHVGQQFDQRHL